MTSYEYVGIAAFILVIAIGLVFVSVHYRNKYEELRQYLEILQIKHE